MAADGVSSVRPEPSNRQSPGDRVGIGWRPELAAAILTHLKSIDVVEVVAEDLFGASRDGLDAFRSLRAAVAVFVHGVSLGLASMAAVDGRRLDRVARVIDLVQPELWSEHLAFVRAGGIEIGHLAAPPRTVATVEGAVRNIQRARQVVGSLPLLENIATLIDPPASDLDEATWTAGIQAASGCGLLLDLNNLHANATNFRQDALAFLDGIPLNRVPAVHLAGGKWIRGPGNATRLLDDHLHDVPDSVYTLLEEVAARTRQPLTVILERDGAYPRFEVLLAQLDLARAALARGRQRFLRANLAGTAAIVPSSGLDGRPGRPV